MYVGRIVAIGKNERGKVCALYRVSSRSFPSRRAVISGDLISILPRPGFEDDLKKNPFIAYNCLGVANEFAVVSNGTHTDLLITKLNNGYGPRDAMVTVLHACDYEHDALSTPRIAGIVDQQNGVGYLGIITQDGLHVKQFTLSDGFLYYVATYDKIIPSVDEVDKYFGAVDAAGCCRYILSEGIFTKMEKPITAACAIEDESGKYEYATLDV